MHAPFSDAWFRSLDSLPLSTRIERVVEAGRQHVSPETFRALLATDRVPITPINDRYLLACSAADIGVHAPVNQLCLDSDERVAKTALRSRIRRGVDLLWLQDMLPALAPKHRRFVVHRLRVEHQNPLLEELAQQPALATLPGVRLREGVALQAQMQPKPALSPGDWRSFWRQAPEGALRELSARIRRSKSARQQQALWDSAGPMLVRVAQEKPADYWTLFQDLDWRAMSPKLPDHARVGINASPEEFLKILQTELNRMEPPTPPLRWAMDAGRGFVRSLDSVVLNALFESAEDAYVFDAQWLERLSSRQLADLASHWIEAGDWRRFTDDELLERFSEETRAKAQQAFTDYAARRPWIHHRAWFAEVQADLNEGRTDSAAVDNVENATTPASPTTKKARKLLAALDEARHQRTRTDELELQLARFVELVERALKEWKETKEASNFDALTELVREFQAFIGELEGSTQQIEALESLVFTPLTEQLLSSDAPALQMMGLHLLLRPNVASSEAAAQNIEQALQRFEGASMRDFAFTLATRSLYDGSQLKRGQLRALELLSESPSPAARLLAVKVIYRAAAGESEHPVPRAIAKRLSTDSDDGVRGLAQIVLLSRTPW